MFALRMKIVAVAAIALVPLLAPLDARANPNEVDIDNFDFSPMILTVPAGTKVTWVNHDDIPHTVRSADDPPAFKSSPMDTDESFSFTFKKSGTYPYFCAIHPKMTAEIIVK